VLFDDGGQLLPDGRAISPALTCTAVDLPRHAPELAAGQSSRVAAVPGGCDALVAGVAGQQDNPQRAVRLLATARSLLKARGSGWLRAVAPRVPHGDAVLEALRSRMGETAFEEAQAWGASTGSRRAREYALG